LAAGHTGSDPASQNEVPILEITISKIVISSGLEQPEGRGSTAGLFQAVTW
jgi:hypothetical protein